MTNGAITASHPLPSSFEKIANITERPRGDNEGMFEKN